MLGYRERREALKFVYDDVVIGPFLFLDISPAESREPEGRYQERTQEVGAVFPQTPLSEIHDENLSFIHDLPKMKIDWRAGEQPIEAWIGEKSADLVLNRGDGFLAIPGVVVGKLLGPERLDLIVLHPSEHLSLERFLREHPQDIGKLRFPEFDKRVEGVSEDVLHSYTPGLAPKLLERFHQSRRRDRDSVRSHSPQGIVAIGL
jgi:hypothetical protein